MLTQDGRVALLDITDLNLLKTELNRLPPIDVGDYIVELPPERRAIAFRLLNKGGAIDVFEYLPPEVQEELIGALHNKPELDIDHSQF